MKEIPFGYKKYQEDNLTGATNPQDQSEPGSPPHHQKDDAQAARHKGDADRDGRVDAPGCETGSTDTSADTGTLTSPSDCPVAAAQISEDRADFPAEATDLSDSTQDTPFDIHSPERLPKAAFPNTQVSTGGNSRLPATIPNVEFMLRRYGITARYNVISKSMQINIPGLSGCPDNADNSAIIYICSLAALNGIPTGPVPQYLEAIADKHQYNPIMDYIEQRPWDGIKRIDALADTLVTEPDFPERLKKSMVRKWLISAVAAAATPSGFRSRGVLTLQGPQSIGKTSWILRLFDDPLVRSQAVKIDHHLDPGNKDSVLTAIRHLIVEIGELDSSLKKDTARLKGFITANQDKIRSPYGRKDSVYQRRTVFIATVNHTNFLVDDTGNSRWWTIPVTEIDYNHDLDMQQLWAQVYQLYRDGHEWWLTPEEEAELETRNSMHRSVNSIRDLVCSALDMDIPEAQRQAMSASELLRHLGITNPTNAQSRDCGAALRELLGEPRVSQGLGRWRVPLGDAGDISEVY